MSLLIVYHVRISQFILKPLLSKSIALLTYYSRCMLMKQAGGSCLKQGGNAVKQGGIAVKGKTYTCYNWHNNRDT